jgi:hypothetical protein
MRKKVAHKKKPKAGKPKAMIADKKDGMKMPMKKGCK